MSDVSEPGQQRHDPYVAFRIPNFRYFVFARVLIMIGTAAQSLAIGWEMYQRTNQPQALGYIGLVQAIPMLLFTLPAGYLADILDRRRIMVVGLIGSTLTSFSLAIFSINQGSIGWMYALLFCDATFNKLMGPASIALLPQLVPRELFENAVKWRTTLFHMSGVIGPAVGGVIISFSVPAAYLFSASTTVIFIIVLLLLKLDPGERSQPGQPVRQVVEGLRFVWRRKLVLGAISLDMFAVLLGGAVYLLPIYVTDILPARAGISPEQMLGWLRAAPAAGSITMALILAHLPPMKQAGRAMFLAVAGFGAVTIVFGFSKNFWLSWAMLFLTGFFDNISVVVRHTLVQLSTPNEMRGRVSSVNSIFIGSSNELGGFESGIVAQWFGPVASVVSGGIGTLLVVGLWTILFPGILKFGSLADVKEREEEDPVESTLTVEDHGRADPVDQDGPAAVREVEDGDLGAELPDDKVAG